MSASKPSGLTDSQARAIDPAASYWVTASAGTGKTRVLTSRVLRLMLAGVAPGKILCITFTKAAAAEMLSRLLERLGKWVKEPDETLAEDLETLLGAMPDEAVMTRARRLFAQVLDEPGGLKIQTIHSFCQSLLARFPLEADISPSFTVMDERTAEELLADSIETVLGAARDGGDIELAWAIREISGHVPESVFRELVTAVARERHTLRRLLMRHEGIDGLIGAMQERLGIGPSDTDRDILEAASSTGAVDHVGLRRATNALLERYPGRARSGRGHQELARLRCHEAHRGLRRLPRPLPAQNRRRDPQEARRQEGAGDRSQCRGRASCRGHAAPRRRGP